MLKIYNSLTQKKEEFIPVNQGKVGIYGCGITPYKPSHLGHAMQGIIFDVMRRYFEYKGFQVTYVRNYTDIEDRIIDRAKKQNMDSLDYSKMIIDICDKDFDDLRVRRADSTPKVTEFIPDIIEGIKLLIDKGYAYATKEGNVYYSISKFEDYGKLSKQKLNQMLNGVRKNIETDKEDVMDFALWKSSKEGEIFWNSPWGKGRPGWHIECSVMSTKYLGTHFDIHGGGSDLLFPHHENEIAQSEAINDGHFANYWVHNGLLMVGEKKMSKSLNNDVSIQDWLKIYHPEIIRYLILTNHYRSHVQFLESRYQDATKKVYQTYKTLGKVKLLLDESKKNTAIIANVDENLMQELTAEFEKFMDNDFNTVLVIAKIHTLLNNMNEILNLKRNWNDNENKKENEDVSKLKTYYEFIILIGKIIGLFDLEPEVVVEEIEELYLKNQKLDRNRIDDLIVQRRKFREIKDFGNSDRIRNELKDLGITLLDKEVGTVWELAV